MPSMDLVLYTNPMSRGRIARWMLEEVGAPYRTVTLAYGPEMKSEAYRALNPMGKVPTLTHGDRVVTECGAICAYLADAFPAAGLAPPPGERADYYRWLFFGAGPIEAATINQALGFTTDDPQQQGMLGYGSLERVVDTLVAAVTAHPFVAGPAFSAADVYLGAQIGWTLEYGSLPRRPELQAYADRARDRDAYRRAMTLDDAEMPQPPT